MWVADKIESILFTPVDKYGNPQKGNLRTQKIKDDVVSRLNTYIESKVNPVVMITCLHNGVYELDPQE
jgi:hypothetical protein